MVYRLGPSLVLLLAAWQLVFSSLFWCTSSVVGIAQVVSNNFLNHLPADDAMYHGAYFQSK